MWYYALLTKYYDKNYDDFFTWSLSVVVEVFNAESPWVLEPQLATHAVLEGRQLADKHTTTGLAAGPGVAFELSCMHARNHAT